MADQPTWPKPDKGVSDSDKLLLEAKIAYQQELAKAGQAEDLERLKNEQARSLAELGGQIASEKAQQDADAARIAANEGAINTSVAAFHNGLIEVSKSAIDRARVGAETVQKAAGAIGGTYTAVLALAFSVSERPLPSRGLVPTILLGWAIVWSTAYLAYLSKSKTVSQPTPTTGFEEGAMRRSIAFIEWTRSGAMNRKYALRVSVFALAFGLALLPAPFINLGKASDSSPAVASSPAWPKKPPTSSEVDKLLYEAEVKEVSELRAESKPIADDGNDTVWWVLCGAGMILSLLVPAALALVARLRWDDDPAAT